MTDSVESFSSMLSAALGNRVEAASFLDMLADDAVMEFPYAPPGLPTRLEGKAAIARHLANLAGLLAFDRMGEPTVHAAAEHVVLEFMGFGRGVSTGEPYEQTYISVIQTLAGKIVHYRDYWNPLVVLRALHGAPFVQALAAAHD